MNVMPTKKDVDWTLLGPDTANFTTHILRLNSQDQITSRRTVLYIAFIFLFIIAGCGLLYFVTYGDPVYRRGRAPFSGADLGGDLLCLTLGIAFTLFSSFTLFCNQEILVDIKSATIEIIDVKFFKEHKKAYQLNNIHALQLIRKKKSSDDYSYWMYELNIILNNKNRTNLLSHGGEKRILKDSAMLSEYINKPIIDNFL